MRSQVQAELQKLESLRSTEAAVEQATEEVKKQQPKFKSA